MINYSETLNRELNTILPTYYELFVDSKTATPCITYIESNNAADVEGDTLAYSRLTFNIKIWTDDYDVIVKKSAELDKKMRELGFRRVSANELWFDNHCQKIFIYEALGLENLN